ncbi:MAG: deoxyribose-phosphate aldolase [Flavobacteriales bacterium]|nr:deoxyribose-phosphate aldolase [Flavobacteriales bacterium]
MKSPASFIDHTLLKAEATSAQIRQLCAEAREHEFASVCVNPAFVELCASELRNSSVSVCTVVGFPLGSTTTAVKVFETRDAIALGANEIDMVVNLGMILEEKWDLLEMEISAIRQMCTQPVVLKVILETSALTTPLKKRAAEIALACGADYLKTSTGMHITGGATREDVRLLAEVALPLGKAVKASGGIRSWEDMQQYLALGATRIGTSSGCAIVESWKSSQTS